MRAFAIALSLSLFATTAGATETTQADQLFSEGRELLEKGRFAEACEKFRQSEEASPAIGTLINLGYCYEQIARYKSAMDAYVEAETLAKRGHDDKRASFARERFNAAEPKALKLVVRVADAASTGIEVKRNNVVVPPAQWGTPTAVDPDDFVITASAPGRTPWRGGVVGRGEGAVMTIIIPTLGDDRGGGADGSRAATGGGGIGSLGTKKLVALGLGGVALGTIGAGTALAFGAKSRYDDSLAHCDGDSPSRCDDRGVSEQQGAVAQGNVATVLIAIGVLCIGSGAYLWLTDDDGGTKTAHWKKPGAFVW